MKQNEKNDVNLNVDLVLFDKHTTSFDCIDLQKFRSIGPGFEKDSTFVYSILKSLYKNEPEKLENRSATGKKFKGKAKLEVTFEKKEIMQNMLIERVKAELCDRLGTNVEYVKRVGRLNVLLRHAISNFVRKRKTGQKVVCILIV